MQYVIALLLIVALLVGGFAWLNRPHFIAVNAAQDYEIVFRDYDWSLNNAN